MKITFDNVEKFISSLPNVENIGWVEHNEFNFSRTYRFFVGKMRYDMRIFANVNHLDVYAPDCDVPCFELTFTGAHIQPPGKAGWKTAVFFQYGKAEFVGSILLERYNQDKEANPK